MEIFLKNHMYTNCNNSSSLEYFKQNSQVFVFSYVFRVKNYMWMPIPNRIERDKTLFSNIKFHKKHTKIWIFSFRFVNYSNSTLKLSKGFCTSFLFFQILQGKASKFYLGFLFKSKCDRPLRSARAASNAASDASSTWFPTFLNI